MNEQTMIQDLDSLALQAKFDDWALEQIIHHTNEICHMVARKYCNLMEYDELLQMARIEVWNAVLTYKKGKMPFLKYCKWTVFNHVKGYLYRLTGPKQSFHRTLIRLHDLYQEEEHLSLENVISDPNTDIQEWLEKKERFEQLHNLLSQNLSELEYRCLIFFYYKGYPYQEIQNTLKLSSNKSVDNALSRLKNKLGKNKELFEILLDLCA